MIDPKAIEGFVFVSAVDGDVYGVIRLEAASDGHHVSKLGLRYLADDDCGNAFALNSAGEVVFWEHETDTLTTLASSWQVFVDNCQPATTAPPDPSKVESAWIDPKFAKELGVDAPDDGWKKKPE